MLGIGNQLFSSRFFRELAHRLREAIPPDLTGCGLLRRSASRNDRFDDVRSLLRLGMGRLRFARHFHSGFSADC
jgi:hypothetical protein